jgi:hypothetical protein
MAGLARLRWRLAGATMWPAFGLAVLASTALLHWLPFAGDQGLGLVPAFLVSGFVCLAVVAAGAPAAGWVLRRRVAGLPKVVADDRAGTALLGLLVLVLLAGGLAHRGTIVEEEQDFASQAIAARRAIATQAPPEFRDGVLSTTKQGPDLYRTCAAGPSPSEAFCVLVMTDQHPPGITVDRDRRPNEVVSGPRNPGRIGG